MHADLHPAAFPFTVAAVVALLIALLIFQRQSVKGGVALALLMLELALAAGASAVRWSLADPQAQLVWLKLAHAAFVAAPVTVLIFVAQLTDMDHWLTNGRMFALAFEPLLTMLLIASNGERGPYYASFTAANSDGFAAMTWQPGPWFWLNTAFSYALMLAATVILFRALLRAGPYARIQLGTILLGCLIPWAVNAWSLMAPAAAQRLELTPLSGVASGLIFSYALFRQRLLDIAPVARSLLFEKLGDAVLVVDSSGRIVDLNESGRRLFHAPASIYGRPLWELLPQWREFVAGLDLTRPEAHFEVEGREHRGRFYDVSIIPLLDSRAQRNGYLVSLRDITERKRAELELHRMNLRLQRQVHKISALHEELREQSIHDALTGLYNRRTMDEALEREFSRARRAGYPISLILLDIDRFKTVNDTYGHKAGDRVLRALGDIIRGQVRSGDIPCRFGGEEFVIVMPETSLDTAAQRAEQIRRRFKAARFFRSPASVAPSLSLGIAAYPLHGRSPEKLLHAADVAMYTAKSWGGDQSVRYEARQKTVPAARARQARE